MSNFWTVTLQQFEDLKDLNLATLLDAIMFGLLIFTLFLFFFCCYILYFEYKSEKSDGGEAEESKKFKAKKVKPKKKSVGFDMSNENYYDKKENAK